MTKRTTAIVEQVLRDGEVSAETLAQRLGVSLSTAAVHRERDRVKLA